MESEMRLVSATWLAFMFAALLVFPAYAAQRTVDVSGRVDIRLGDFAIVIGDMGDKYSNWNDSSTRVSVNVMDSGRTRDYYFDNLPAALFVLRQMYDQPRIMHLRVPDYYGQGLIDGTQAYYLWDNEHQSRGGTPLLLAFANARDAQDELRYRSGSVMDFNDVMQSLGNWAESDRGQIYWRGSNRDQWDATSWNSAWDNRWQGWGWDHERGWNQGEVQPGQVDPARQDLFVRDNQRTEKRKADHARQDKIAQDNNSAKQHKDDSARVAGDKKDKTNNSNVKGHGKVKDSNAKGHDKAKNGKAKGHSKAKSHGKAKGHSK
jgi:hypothetical protein